MQTENSLADSLTQLSGSPITSLPSSATPEQPFSARQSTRKGKEKLSASESKSHRPRNRREELLRRLGVDLEALAGSPQIGPILRQNGVNLERLSDTLRCDTEEESQAFVRVYDSLTIKNRSLAGVEAMAIAAGLTPRRLWELFQGALLVQSRDAVEAKIALVMPSIIDVTIRNAKKAKGFNDREHLYKISRALPTPKGSTTIINPIGQPQLPAALPEEENDELLESADSELNRFAKVMHAKQLPAPVEEIPDGEVVEPDEEDE